MTDHKPDILGTTSASSRYQAPLGAFVPHGAHGSEDYGVVPVVGLVRLSYATDWTGT